MDLQEAKELFLKVSKGDPNFILAGSARREKAVGLKDIDVIYVGSDMPILEHEIILAKGNTFARLKVDGIRVDIHRAEVSYLGATLLHFTGSKESNIRLRKKANSLGLMLNQYGLFKNGLGNCILNKDGLPVSLKEEYIFEALGEPFLTPKERSVSAEVELNTKIVFNLKLLGIYHDMLKEPFKAKAYHNASEKIKVVSNLAELATNNKLIKIEGVGNSIALKIKEFIDTGEIKKLEELKLICPVEVEEFLQLDGIGTNRLYKLHNELGIKTLGDLKVACENNRVSQLKGFGNTIQQNILIQLL